MNPHDSHIHLIGGYRQARAGRAARSRWRSLAIGSAGWRSTDRPRARSSTAGRVTPPRAAATRDPAARGRPPSRGSARSAQSGGPVHGRRVGVPRGRRGPPRRAPASRRSAPPRFASCSRRRASSSTSRRTLIPFSRWITPAQVKIRFDTWFFLALPPASRRRRVDGPEIVACALVSPGPGARGSRARRAAPRLSHRQAPGAARPLRLGGRARCTAPVRRRSVPVEPRG